jgi:hypothetical protein
VSKFIAIDLAPDGIFAVAGSARGGHAKVEQAVSWTEADGEASPLLSGDTARRIGEQLRDKLRDAGIQPAPVLVCVGRGRVILKELRYPAVPPSEEPAVVKFQAMKELSDAADDVVLDYTPLSNGAPDGERRSMAVVIRKDLYSAIQQMCAAANLRLAAVTPRPYAVAAGLARAFGTGAVPAPESKAEAVAALVLGPAGGEFTVTRNGEVTFTRDVPGPVVTSEPMLLGEVRRNLTMYAGGSPGHPVSGLYLAEAAGGWAGRLRAALGIPVAAYDPLNGGVPEIAEPIRGRFAGAAGLLAAKAADALPINFAAPRQPKASKDPKQRQLLVVALGALVLLGGFGLLGLFTLNAADQRVGALRRQKTDLEDQVKKLEPDAKRLDAANKWKARQVNWLDELYEMSERFKSSDKFTAASFDGRAIDPDPKTGNQPNQARIDVKVASRDIGQVNALVDAMRGEPKYYVGAEKSTGGPVQGDPQAREYTVLARVNGRPPEQYTRGAPAGFKPPVRTQYPPKAGASRAEPKEKPADTEKTDADGAPGPREKPAVGEGEG